jgi:hypothetical protein
MRGGREIEKEGIQRNKRIRRRKNRGGRGGIKLGGRGEMDRRKRRKKT